MDHFELVEKLVNTFGVSFEKAKNALEASDWDPVEAAVLIEREKNGIPTEPKVETEIPHEEPKAVPQNEEPNSEEPKRKFSTEARQASEKAEAEFSRFFGKVWSFFTKNNFVLKKNSGDVFIDIPIWLAITLFCAFFWVMFFILIILLIMGYRISFTGPQLGKKSVKGTVNKAADFAEDMVEKVRNSLGNDETQPNAEGDSEPEVIIETVINVTEEDHEKKCPEEAPFPTEPEINKDPTDKVDPVDPQE